MRYIKFKQATGYLPMPAEADIPYVIDGAVAVTCLEMTERDFWAVRKNGGRLFVITPVGPPGDRPIPIKILTFDPFKKEPPQNGQDKS